MMLSNKIWLGLVQMRLLIVVFAIVYIPINGIWAFRSSKFHFELVQNRLNIAYENNENNFSFIDNFSRKATKNDGSLQEFLLPNMNAIDCKIVFNDKTVERANQRNTASDDKSKDNELAWFFHYSIFFKGTLTLIEIYEISQQINTKKMKKTLV